MVLSVIATLISSVALVGVAVGLLLQARQLRAGQLQAARSLHTELIKIGMENPSIAGAIESDFDPADGPKAAYLNLLITSLRTSYQLNVIPKAVISFQAQRIFAAEFPRSWWAITRDNYMGPAAATKREKEFAMLVDAKFQEAMRNLEGSSS
jgi:Family of unknown function (DUF6082)